MVMLFCILLTSNSEDGLWPLANELFPKNILGGIEDYTLFQKSFLDICNFVNDKNIVTVTDIKYSENVKQQLKELQEKFGRKIAYKTVIEPITKNSLASISLASKYLRDNFKYFSENSLILVMNSDSFFDNRDILANKLEQATKLAENGYIVSFGIKSSSYNENTSYFKVRKNPAVTKIEPCAYKVSQYFDRLSKKNIEELKTEKIFANTGVYLFSYSTFLSELKKYSNKMYSFFTDIYIKDKIPSIPLSDYEQVADISIETELIANTKKLAFLDIETEHNIINNWETVYKKSKKDINENCILGKVVDLNSKNSLIFSTNDKLIATLGIKDMVVVSTDIASYVSKRSKTDNVKKIKKKLNEKKSIIKEMNKTYYRPWGYYTVLERAEGFLTKCISVNPNAKLSLQKHFHRSEHWIILEGVANIIKNDEEIILQAGESIDIAIEEIHSLRNFANEPLKILEVQMGDLLDENDIERIEDIYGRV